MTPSTSIPRKGATIAEALEVLQMQEAAGAIEQAGDSFIIQCRFEIAGLSLRGDLAFDDGLLEDIQLYADGQEFTLPEPIEGWNGAKYHVDKNGQPFATLE